MPGLRAIYELNTFLSGISKITNILYYISLITFCIFLTNLSFPGIKQEDKNIVI